MNTQTNTTVRTLGYFVPLNSPEWEFASRLPSFKIRYKDYVEMDLIDSAKYDVYMKVPAVTYDIGLEYNDIPEAARKVYKKAGYTKFKVGSNSTKYVFVNVELVKSA